MVGEEGLGRSKSNSRSWGRGCKAANIRLDNKTVQVRYSDQQGEQQME